MRRSAHLLVIFALLAVVGACGPAPQTGPAEPGEETAGVETEEPGVETEEAGPVEGQLEESELVAELDQSYGLDASGAPTEADPAGLPAPAGSVQAHWYDGGGRYVVVFGGLNLTEAGSLCPGTSIQIEGEFRAVGNSPTEEGACPGSYTIHDNGGARICGDMLMYVTQIFSAEQGDLFASIDKLTDDGSVNGITGSVATGPVPPAIDLEESTYVLPASLGGAEITCDPMD